MNGFAGGAMNKALVLSLLLVQPRSSLGFDPQRTCLISAMLLPRAVPDAPSQDPRRPVPDAPAQAAVEKTIRELFKDEYSKRAPADVAALAKKLLQQGLQTNDDMTGRFGLPR